MLPKPIARVLLGRLVGNASLSFSTVRTWGTGVNPPAQLVPRASISLFDVRLNRLMGGFLRATSQLTRPVAEVLLLAQPVAGHRCIAEPWVSCRLD